MPKDTFFNLPEEKRERIIDAAINQFSKLHYSNVTIDGIVKDARIPKGSFYQYFQNEDDLYVYLFTQVSNTKMNMLQNLKKEIIDLTFKEYMMKFIMELKKLEASSSRILQLKQEFLSECPQEIKKQILKEELPKSFKLIQEVIDLYIDKGEFRSDLDSKTASYATSMCISSLEYYNLSEGEEILEVLMKTIDLLVYGMTSHA